LGGKTVPPKDREGPVIQFMSMGAKGRKATERMLNRVERAMEGREFSSPEEANRFVKALVEADQAGEGVPLEELTPEQQAQELIYDAWEVGEKRKRLELARRALELWPDCADAYVLLAEEGAKTVEEAKELYERGVAAGERVLGPEAFKEDAGHFWGITRTRPYMRARAGLARCLWKLGSRNEAISHFREMLRLNPNDNQGVRYELINWLLIEGRDKEARELLNRYSGDPTALWRYPEALWLFRREGPTNRANRALKKALEANAHVPPYLLGKRKLPREMPDYYVVGDESEAVIYAASALEAWAKTPWAREWLATAYFWYCEGSALGPRRGCG
jgi:tetratricopeptide (TPR) repeat protein